MAWGNRRAAAEYRFEEVELIVPLKPIGVNLFCEISVISEIYGI